MKPETITKARPLEDEAAAKKSSSSESFNQLMAQEKVALKILDKAKIRSSLNNAGSLINEVRAHWILEQCEGVLKILGIHDNENYIIFVLEYQPKGSLIETL